MVPGYARRDVEVAVDLAFDSSSRNGAFDILARDLVRTL